MKSTTCALWVLALAGCAVADHPIQRVIDMLSGLQAQAVKDAKDQELIHEEAIYNFNNRRKQIEKDLKSSTKLKQTSEAQITTQNAELEALSRTTAKLQDEVAKAEEKDNELKEKRQNKIDVFEARDKELKNAEGAIHDAVDSISSAGTVFLQKRMQRNPHDVGATDHTHAIEDLGTDLEHDVEHQEEDLVTQHTNFLNNLELALNSIKSEIQAKNDLISDKTAATKTAQEELAEAEGQLADATTSLTDAKTAQSDLTGEVEIEADDNKRIMENYKNIEISLGKAIAALEKSTGVSHSVPENAAAPEVPSFLQLAGSPDRRMRAVELLRKEAQASHSKALSHLAERLASATKGPFDEINNLIQKMAHRLEAEQQDEDKHKAWCDHELEETNFTRDELASKIAKRDAEIEKLEARVKSLTDTIADCDDKLQQNAEFVSEATKIRKESSEENAVCIKDAQEAQSSLEQAEQALQQFYSEVSEEAAAPVKDVMTKTMEKFSQNEAECKSNEQTAETKFKEDKTTAKIETANLRKRSELKTEQKTQATKSLQESEGAKEKLQSQAATAQQYFTDLQPSCVDGDSSYEERKAARDEEIQALHDAEELLKNYKK